MPKRYSDKQKIAYYKKKAKQAERGRYMKGRGDYYRPGRQRYIKGSGDYKMPHIAKGTFSNYGRKWGKAIAPGIFSDLGGEVGHLLGAGVAKLIGQGDYAVTGNTLVHPRMIPTFGSDSIRVKKREMIAIMGSSSGYSNTTFPLNPGSDITFPWLSRIAANYEQYHMNGCVFSFHSTSSTSIASTTDLALGQIALATDYNASDEPYRNLQQALGSMFANTGRPSEDIAHAIECAPSEQQQKSYYVRTGDVPTGSDIKLYDMGNFQFIVDGVATYPRMGQLWVSYDVTLFKSVQNNQLGLDLNDDKYKLYTISTSNYFGTTRTANEHNNLGTSLSADRITFPATLSSGYFKIFYRVLGSSTAVIVPTITGTNCEAETIWQNDSVTHLSNTGSTSTSLLLTIVYKVTSPGAYIVFSGGTLPASATSGDLTICQVNGDVFIPS